ncbi:MAG: phosphoribosylanthranilate isomerase [Planctomycetota bacterium]|jgi:phosphoribosylanthranilate isomerase
MITVKTKICGITNLDDAQAAVEMGADILGFNFYEPSPRYIEPQKAEAIIAQLSAFVDIAGVFVNANAPDIRALTDDGLLNWVQLHGDETPEFCAQFNMWNVRTIKAVRVKDADSIQQAQQFQTHSLLFDAFDPKLYGGTGSTFDWKLVKECPRRIFLAGGINPDNVVEALKIEVYAVDVCSGIEAKPGIKDHKKMEQLFNNIQDYRGMKVRK